MKDCFAAKIVLVVSPISKFLRQQNYKSRPRPPSTEPVQCAASFERPVHAPIQNPRAATCGQLRLGGPVARLRPAAIRSEELAVAPPATPNPTSSNARPARPCQPLPPHVPGSIRLRVLHSVPSGDRVYTCTEATNVASSSGSVYLLKTGLDSMIGPNVHVFDRDTVVGTDCRRRFRQGWSLK